VGAAPAGAAGQDGAHDRHGGVQRGDVLALIAAGPERLALRMTRQRGQAARGIDGQVPPRAIPVGTRLAERRHRGHDQARVGGPERAGVEPARRRLGRGQVVQEHVRARGQLPQDLATAIARDVQGDAAAVGVVVKEEQALLRVHLVAREGAHVPPRVAGARRLDEDDLGAVLAEQAATVRAAQLAREVQHPQPRQRSSRLRHRCRPPHRPLHFGRRFSTNAA
jgi:hypothetical protein